MILLNYVEIRNLINKYDNGNCIYFIPFNEFPYKGDIRIIGMYAIHIREMFSFFHIDTFVHIDYNGKRILIMYVSKMEKTITIDIPYGSRSKYLSLISQINELVDEAGAVIVAVNNNPGLLKCFLVIETTENIDVIKDLVSESGLTQIYDIGLSEIIQGIGNGQYNPISLIQNMTLEEIRDMYMPLFLFAETETLETV